MKTLIIDNYDSYTFNLYQFIAEVNGKNPIVIRNDEVDWENLTKIDFDNVVISPGPGRPEKIEDFGICGQVLQNIQVPVLGVCLGHQGLGYFYGGKIIHAPEIKHGRLSEVYHNHCQLFQGLPSSFLAVCYNSLVVADDIPECLEKIAWTPEGVVMGLRHRNLPFWGVQFHPESICTEYGKEIFNNFRNITANFYNYQIPENTNHQNILLTKKHQKQKQQQYQVCSKKLDIYPDAEQVFTQLFGDKVNTFWLDSSRYEPGLSRFSFMGDNSGVHSLLVEYQTQNQEIKITQGGKITTYHESIFDYLQREIKNRYYVNCVNEELPFDFNCGFVGYFGYELKAECGGNLVHNSELPDAMFILADRIIAFDHQEQVIYLVCLTTDEETAKTWFSETELKLQTLSPIQPIIKSKLKPQPQEKIKFNLQQSEKNYLEDIQTSLKEIYEGETYQVCLTNKLSTEFTPEPLEFYRTLRKINPAPYSAFLKFDNFTIACSSPERFLSIDSQGWVETKPIKGTLPRGKTPQEDELLKASLRNSEKDRSENLMIVDLLRNDLGRVCQVGSVHVPKLMDVETYSTVHQLVTTIRGLLRPEMDAIDCIKNAFPGGSMTGAPKIRTMEIIDKLEPKARGVYSGAIGFLSCHGTADLNIVIRTAILTDQQTSIGVGGGIVILSNPQAELAEMLLKAEAVVDALKII
ncbi:aminodeoxychorismate synthase component I [Sphaerospermopsis sp. LEGE 00249]|uniref:aminodeoxychorismate synthase component I n=1 Tax=Sphaerospermopsis sp. LEGE 00249 TaxID=1380707 RepID=UPI00164D4DB9|nr:aminodeoxychorismate synthase component I [Sphaerospermopsis sp. LEGE 00249]